MIDFGVFFSVRFLWVDVFHSLSVGLVREGFPEEKLTEKIGRRNGSVGWGEGEKIFQVLHLLWHCWKDEAKKKRPKEVVSKAKVRGIFEAMRFGFCVLQPAWHFERK